MSFGKAADGSVVVEVQQFVRDLEGRPLQDQAHGLQDKVIGHVFRLQNGKVARFDIQVPPRSEWPGSFYGASVPLPVIQHHAETADSLDIEHLAGPIVR